MINLSMNVVLLVSILNTYLRSKYESLVSLCEIEDLDYEELLAILDKNNYYFDEKLVQIKEK